MPRIAVVGGGSAHWTPRLLVDSANTASLSGSSVRLMDTAHETLPRMCELADHIADTRGIGLRVMANTDLDAALDGAEFVVTGLSVGGFDAMVHDLEIPTRYGVRQPVGDSVGPGGIARALRSVPVMTEIAAVKPLREARCCTRGVGSRLRRQKCTTPTADGSRSRRAQR
jgi:alpha-galactosidase/6-phospho-beta-glucosidase family protein